MSGSRTADFGASLNPEELTGSMNREAPAPPSAGTPNKDDITKKRSSVPVGFKLKLIAEVRKHDIIWQDLKQKKNSDLIEDAWQRVRKALLIKKVGFCEKQWKLLIHGYRSHINRGTPMNIDLIRDMVFMQPQLKKSHSDVDQSDSEVLEVDTPVKKAAQTPKPKKVAKHSADSDISDPVSEAQKASVSILKLLFKNVPSEVMLPVRNSLVEVLIKVMPDVNTKISEHAKQQLTKSGDLSKLDWSALDIPVEICKAVWDYKVMQKLLND